MIYELFATDGTLVARLNTRGEAMPDQASTIELGDEAYDVISGFRGIVTGIVHYLTGCHQAVLSPKVKDDGSLPSSQWFDLDRLAVSMKAKVNLNVTTAGFGDQPPSPA